MGRKNIVSDRLIDILDGKLLRFTDIHNEYKKHYKKVAYKQVADNLKLLMKKGIVFRFIEHYCLAEDFAAGKLEDKKRQLLDERDKELERKLRKFEEASEEDFERTLQTLIKEKDYDEMRKMAEGLEKLGYCLAVAGLLMIASGSIWDQREMEKLASRLEQRVDRLKKISEQEG